MADATSDEEDELGLRRAQEAEAQDLDSPPVPVGFAFDTNFEGGRNATDTHNDVVEQAAAVEVPLPFVINTIDAKIMKSNLYTDMLVYIPFIVMFTFFASNGREITESYYVTSTLRDQVMGNEIGTYEVTKVYEDIATLQDWRDWYRTVLVPNVFGPCGVTTNGTVKHTRTMQGRNLLLGAMRLRTIRASNQSCTLESNLFSNPDTPSEIPCFGTYRGGEEKQLRFGFQNPLEPLSADKDSATRNSVLYQHVDCWDLEGGQYISGYLSLYHCGGYIVDVPFDKSCGEVLRLEEEMVAFPFIDELQTRLVTVEFFVFSPVTNAFTSVKLFTEVSPAGAVLPNFQFRTFMVWTQNRNQANTIYDFFFFAYVLYYCYKFVKEWFIFKRTTGKVLAFVFDVWNLMEFANLVIFMVVFGTRWAWWDVSKMSSETTMPFAPKYPKDLDLLLTLWSTTVYANACNVTLVFLKLLKFLRLNPRLGVLTMSIAERKSQLVGILLIFSWSVFTFALAGMSLFGGVMWEFHSLDTAFTTLLRMLVGDFGRLGPGSTDDGIYPSMRRENRVLAGVFFWMYVVLVFFILLNMVIAVLAEGFAVVSAKYSTTPLAEEVQRFINSLLRVCRPERMAAQIALFRKGMSTTDCLQRVLQNIQEHNLILKGEDQDADDSQTMLTRDTFKMYMSIHEYRTLGPAYVNDLWFEIVMEFKDSDTTDEVQRDKELRESVSIGTERVLDPVSHTIQEMHQRVRTFDLQLCHLLVTLQKQIDDPTPATIPERQLLHSRPSKDLPVHSTSMDMLGEGAPPPPQPQPEEENCDGSVGEEGGHGHREETGGMRDDEEDSSEGKGRKGKDKGADKQQGPQQSLPGTLQDSPVAPS